LAVVQYKKLSQGTVVQSAPSPTSAVQAPNVVAVAPEQ
jgi:hypothetical protein